VDLSEAPPPRGLDAPAARQESPQPTPPRRAPPRAPADSPGDAGGAGALEDLSVDLESHGLGSQEASGVDLSVDSEGAAGGGAGGGALLAGGLFEKTQRLALALESALGRPALEEVYEAARGGEEGQVSLVQPGPALRCLLPGGDTARARAQILESQLGGAGPAEVERVRGELQTLLFCEEALLAEAEPA
jgi:hypothetical protein